MADRVAQGGLAGVALLAAALVPAVGGAQEFSEATSVLVVEVPVNVTRDGEPVTGLTAADFELTDEGKGQTISGFDVLDLRDAASAAQVATMSVAARRHFVFVFDLSFSEPNAVARSRQAALEVVHRGLHPSDLIAVATYSTRQGPQLVLSFTTDRRQVAEAFSTLGLLGGARRIEDPLGMVVRPSAVAADLEATTEGGSEARGGLAPDEELQEVLERLDDVGTRADLKSRVDAFAGTFGFLADMIAPLDGRKHVVFLSEGFDASALVGTFDQERIAEMQEAAEYGELWDIDSEERFGSSEAQSAIQTLMQRFREADATIHSIDIGGLRTDGGSAFAGGRQDGLYMLSRETDGEFYRNYNDLSEAMGEMLERTSVTYVLAFQPSDPQRKKDSFHRLRVKLKDAPRGTRLSYRQGYFPPDALGTLDETQRSLRAAQQMHGAAPTGGITARILATPLGIGSERAYVPVMLQVPASELTANPLGDTLPLEIYAYAMDAEGGVHDYFAESLRFDVKQLGRQLESTGIKYYGHLDLAPGDYALRIMIRDLRTGATSVEVTPLTVPRLDEPQLTVLPPLFPEATDHWVTARESDERAATRPMRYPFLFKGESFVPAVHPVFEAGRVVAVSLMATKPGDDWLEVGALVLGPDGTPVPGTFLRVLERETDDQDGLERMIAAFEVPNLPAGDYQLVVTMSDTRSGDVESGTLAFSLGQQADAALFAPPPWMPDLSQIVTQLGPPEGEKIVKVDRVAVEQGYREALQHLAEGQQTAAVLRLAQLESSMVNRDDPMSSLTQIDKVQWQVLEDLAARDTQLLLPAILLHKEAYAQYRLRKESFLAVHSRRKTEELIDLYAQRVGTDQASQLASRVLTGMAAEVYGSGAHISARQMFARASELDPTNGAALLGLGFLSENMGQGDNKTPLYAGAVQFLERAVEVAPELHEARLRLAVNLRRVGRPVDAGRQLQLLIDRDDVPPWVASLAYQELARVYLDAEAYAQARKVLERGVEALPQDSKLSLQLAYVYERTQQQRLADRAAERATGESLAARYLYLQVPQPLGDGATLWTETAQRHLPALAAALGPAAARVGSR